jgi:hypothetical protein
MPKSSKLKLMAQSAFFVALAGTGASAFADEPNPALNKFCTNQGNLGRLVADSNARGDSRNKVKDDLIVQVGGSVPPWTFKMGMDIVDIIYNKKITDLVIGFRAGFDFCEQRITQDPQLAYKLGIPIKRPTNTNQ